jgi:hypothetical protein
MKAAALKFDVPCTCGECDPENQSYQCATCKRIVPWCFGMADKYFDDCDDCAVEKMRADGTLKKEQTTNEAKTT